MEAPSPARYHDWKAPADDAGRLIWPDPRGQLLADARDNARRLAAAADTQFQRVPLPEVRRRLRQWLGHADDAAPFIATGHQTELYHPGVWVKNVLIHLTAERLGGQAYHFAVDTDEPKHLHLRWPGASEPLTDDPPAAASWAGLLDAPPPQRVGALEQLVAEASANWPFEPLVPRFLGSMRRLALDAPKLAPALTNALHELDWSLGLRHHAMVFSPVCHSEPYLVFVHHVMARAGAFAADYNAALDEYRRLYRVRTPGRPMPNLNASDDEAEAPFWLDELGTGHRYRAAVVRMGDRWAMRAPSAAAAGDDVFVFDPAADGWDAAARLLAWLRRNDLRLSPRALTLTMLLRLLVADQFVHGIGGGRYDRVTDALIARHCRLEPPRFAVTTATLQFPGAVGRSRVCMPCVLQDGHRLRHNVIGRAEKGRLVEAIAAAPRRSAARSSLFSQMHGRLAAAARHPDILRWQQERDAAEARDREDRVIFDRELFYAFQSEQRLVDMIDAYRAAVTG